MRVGIDAGPLALTSGGLRRYIAELTAALEREYPADDLVLMSDERGFAGVGPRNWLERRWWAFGAGRACRRERIDVFHGTNFAVPYRAGRATVLTLHDLSPWMDPAWHAGADRVRRRSPGMIRNHATMVITPSAAVRTAAIERFALKGNRVVAIPHAAGKQFARVVTREPAGEPYFLFVGTLEPRKNLGALLEARRQVPASRLLIAGRRRADFPPLEPEAGVEWLGEMDESRLPGLYSGAIAVLYPSLYEGFGLPVLEAMQCGACVITSRDPAIMEVAGGAAMHVTGVAEMAEAMRAVRSQPALLASFREKALRRAAEFSWERTARATRKVYEEAVNRFERG